MVFGIPCCFFTAHSGDLRGVLRRNGQYQLAGGVLIALKKYSYAPYALAVLIFLSLLFFIYGIYYYVSVVMVGIDLDSFDPEFIVCTIFYILAFGVSVANLFIRQIKKEAVENEQEN